VITRRAALCVFAAGAVVPQGMAFAQQPPKIARIAILHTGTRAENATSLEPFIAGMRAYGYVVGKNLLLEERYTDTRPDRLPALAAELAALKPDVLVTRTSVATDAAANATSTIAIVFVGIGDPVASGFVKSLRQPGRNLTGISILNTQIIRKQLEIALELFPGLQRVAVLMNPDNPGHPATLSQLAPDASRLRMELVLAPARNADEMSSAFGMLAGRGIRLVIIRLDPLFTNHARHIAELALKHNVWTVAAREYFVTAGCLLSYGPDRDETLRRGAYHVDRILKGANPADLPVEQPTKFELHANLRTAKALGASIPQSLLVQANRVIE
jgi:putative tryptophan/tyrosine transport system substrate-binding protein